MRRIREKHCASLCLSAAFLTLLAPALFLFHTDRCGAHSPLCSLLVPERADAEGAFLYEHARHGRHDPNACLTCQALIQYVSGVTPGCAQAVSVAAKVRIHGCSEAGTLPRERCFPPFFSRAPPFDSACSATHG